MLNHMQNEYDWVYEQKARIARYCNSRDADMIVHLVERVCQLVGADVGLIARSTRRIETDGQIDDEIQRLCAEIGEQYFRRLNYKPVLTDDDIQKLHKLYRETG